MNRRAFEVALLALAWRPALSRPQPGTPEQRRFEAAQHEFEELVRAACRLTLAERTGFVNTVVNQRIAYAADASTGSGLDHWDTPLETLERHAGDCEDVAITKYFLLAASGAPAQGLRLLYAWRCLPDTPALRKAHVVALAGWPFEDPWVLDSINPLLLALSQREDLEPVFSFDREQLWQRIDARPHPPPRALPQPWREVLQRLPRQTH